MADIHQIKRIFEAALLGAGQPLALPQLAALFDEHDMPSHEEIARALEELQADAEGRGVELVEVASGFRYQVREDVHPFVSRLWTERQTRYSRALLETLALIAYRQPITRAEIEQIRGVGVASSIVKTLEEREWVRVVGYRDLPGKPALFCTRYLPMRASASVALSVIASKPAKFWSTAPPHRLDRACAPAIASRWIR